MSEEDAAAQGLSREELERMDAEAEAEGDEEVGFSLTFRFAASNPFFEEGLEEVTLHCYSHGEIAQVTPEALPWREGMDPRALMRPLSTSDLTMSWYACVGP